MITQAVISSIVVATVLTIVGAFLSTLGVECAWRAVDALAARRRMRVLKRLAEQFERTSYAFATLGDAATTASGTFGDFGVAIESLRVSICVDASGAVTQLEELIERVK